MPDRTANALPRPDPEKGYRRIQARNPDRVRLVALADPHLSAHNPAAWKDSASYEEHTEAVLAQIWRLADKVDADAILVAGDLLHLRPVSRNPLSFLIRSARRLRAAGRPVLAIAGNHDLTRGSIENGLGEPFAAVMEMSGLHLLDGDPVGFEMPWTALEPFTVGVCGASFDHARADSFLALPAVGNRTVALGHFAFGDKSGEFFGEPVYGPDSLGAGHFDVAVVGHHHYDQGIREVGGKTYVAVGSTSWTSIHDADAGRRPAASMIEVTREGDVTATVLRPSVPDFADLVDVDGHREAVEEAKGVGEFLSQLAAASWDAGDPEKILDSLGADAEVRERAREYLEAAEA